MRTSFPVRIVCTNRPDGNSSPSGSVHGIRELHNTHYSTGRNPSACWSVDIRGVGTLAILTPVHASNRTNPRRVVRAIRLPLRSYCRIPEALNRAVNLAAVRKSCQEKEMNTRILFVGDDPTALGML